MKRQHLCALLPALLLTHTTAQARPDRSQVIPATILDRCLGDLDQDGTREAALLFEGDEQGTVRVMVVDMAFVSVLYEGRAPVRPDETLLACDYGELRWLMEGQNVIDRWAWDQYRFVRQSP